MVSRWLASRRGGMVRRLAGASSCATQAGRKPCRPRLVTSARRKFVERCFAGQGRIPYCVGQRSTGFTWRSDGLARKRSRRSNDDTSRAATFRPISRSTRPKVLRQQGTANSEADGTDVFDPRSFILQRRCRQVASRISRNIAIGLCRPAWCFQEPGRTLGGRASRSVAYRQTPDGFGAGRSKAIRRPVDQRCRYRTHFRG
jgi:hypothetical protein